MSPNYRAKQIGLAISSRDSVTSARDILSEKVMLNDCIVQAVQLCIDLDCYIALRPYSGHLNLVHIIKSNFSKIKFNIILSYTPMYSR